MSTDYKSKKVADLTELLKARSLPHSGKKDELIQRLERHDAEQAAANPPPTTTTTTAAADGAEDEIDWEEDADVTDNPVVAAAIAAIAAGGLVRPPNPTSVPNQIVDIDPSKTSDLTVNPPAQEETTTSTKTADTTTTTTIRSQTKEPEKDTPPKPDYTTGLASTTLDTELEKRKKRAARFGIQETDTDALKALERAKKFGTGDAGDKAAVKGLDEALPERSRKRGRGGDEGGGGRPGGEKRSRNRETGGTPKGGAGAGGGGKGARGYSEADRAKAEERKRRFG